MTHGGCHQRHALTLVATALLLLISVVGAEMSKCRLNGESQRCMPSFVNAAYGRRVAASNTCGQQAEEYCLQTGRQGVTKSCHICDASEPDKSHNAEYLTDLSEDMDAEEGTWWQSNSMIYDIQHPNMVNLTLNLSKTFDITYVRLKFHSPRPESFAIYKKKCHTCDWQPWQYYSGSCFSTYGIDNEEIVTVEDEQKALCTDEFSDISPLTGGNIAFSTLEGRPSAYEFDRSPKLQDWVKAVAIRITLNRLNTFGDEVFKDPEVLKSYFYAVSDLSVGGRCSCNGHANKCYLSSSEVIVCRCQHNTAGPDCDRCADAYNDLQWRAATRDDPAVCQKCDCNGKSEKCEYDHSVFLATGRGGRCLECMDNTDGPNCQRCLPYHYRDASTDRCEACNCNQIGSRSQQCDEDGQCMCKLGVGGKMCDQCLQGYYGLSEAGCSLCRCYEAGTESETICDSETGQCVCKLNVEGLRCNKCKLGSMSLRASNPFGCISCFCFGHSNVCSVSSDYTQDKITSAFYEDTDGWEGAEFGGESSALRHGRRGGGDISMEPHDRYLMSFFVAPDKYLGDQQKSYGQFLTFDLRLEEIDRSPEGGSGDDNRFDVRTSRHDVYLEGGGFQVSLDIKKQNNPVPSAAKQTFTYRLHETLGFEPQLTAFQFQKLLNDLTALKIRSTYARGARTHLYNVALDTAVLEGDGEPADWVEECSQDGYTPGALNTCREGFTRDPPGGDSFDPCVPCNCNGHGDQCAPLTGVCVCEHNTVGEHCELCAEGFYFNGDERRRGTPQECQPCPCPDGSGCAMVAGTDEVVCVNCPVGYAGKQCELCTDGWFGEPRGRGPCQQCVCNGNVDENAVMNCNTTTGQCLKCIYNTTGWHCDQCLPGYFGKPITNDFSERCQLCECDALGSRQTTDCDAMTGNCDCYPFVTGQKCDRCQEGYWNLKSGGGCDACQCHQIGSVTGECDEDTGECVCHPGVGGDKCDQCLPNHYGMTLQGCKQCDCNPDGSASLQCGENGKCVCKDGVLGLKCDMCQENFHDIKAGCIECPACYGLVQDAVAEHRGELAKLEGLISDVGVQSIGQGDAKGDQEFEQQLQQLNQTVADLYEQALENDGRQKSLRASIDLVSTELHKIFSKLTEMEGDIDHCAESIDDAESKSNQTSERRAKIANTLERVTRKLASASSDLAEARRIAQDTDNKHDNMTRLAAQAEEIAGRLSNESGVASSTAQEALDTSERARKSIEEALEVLDNLMLSLADATDAENKIPAAENLRDDLTTQADLIRREAEAAKNKSTDLFTEAEKLNVPAVDTDVMIGEANQIINDAADMQPGIQNLTDQYDSKYFELNGLIQTADQMYSTMEANQQSVDQLLARADAVFQQANRSVVQGNTTYESLLLRLQTLQSFDEEINTTQTTADKALAMEGDIRKTIVKAQNITTTAERQLGQSREIAKQASNKAEQSLNIAITIQADAEKIKKNAGSSQAQANEIQSGANNLYGKLDDVNDGLTVVENQIATDRNRLGKAVTTTSEARGNAAMSKTKVNNLMKKLDDLITNLDALDPADDSEIERLERELKRLEEAVEEEQLTDKIATLKSESAKQQTDIEKYEIDISELERDVENLKKIKMTIPKGCATSQLVEQP